MRIHQESSEETAGVNLTPMIDVVFLLLIFFLVASRFEEQERDLKTILPEVISAEPIAGRKDLIVNIRKNGEFLVNQKKLTKAELYDHIVENKKANPHQKVLIRGDGRSMLKYGVDVMSLCNKAKVEYRIAALLQQ